MRNPMPFLLLALLAASNAEAADKPTAPQYLNSGKVLPTNLPFSEAQLAAARNADPEVEHLYVYFLPDAPAPEKLDALHGLEAGDTVVAGQREIYLLCAQSVRLSKTAIRLGKAFPTATARNWNTVCKLRDLLSAM